MNATVVAVKPLHLHITFDALDDCYDRNYKFVNADCLNEIGHALTGPPDTIKSKTRRTRHHHHRSQVQMLPSNEREAVHTKSLGLSIADSGSHSPSAGSSPPSSSFSSLSRSSSPSSSSLASHRSSLSTGSRSQHRLLGNCPHTPARSSVPHPRSSSSSSRTEPVSSSGQHNASHPPSSHSSSSTASLPSPPVANSSPSTGKSAESSQSRKRPLGESHSPSGASYSPSSRSKNASVTNGATRKRQLEGSPILNGPTSPPSSLSRTSPAPPIKAPIRISLSSSARKRKSPSSSLRSDSSRSSFLNADSDARSKYSSRLNGGSPFGSSRGSGRASSSGSSTQTHALPSSTPSSSSPKPFIGPARPPSMSRSASSGGASSLNSGSPQASSLFSSFSGSSQSQPCKKRRKFPLVGLRNLGNTCFMNSTLQCLASLAEFREYFLSGAYKPDINTVNPIGCKGQLSTQYARLLEEMARGTPVIEPWTFKHTIGRYASQFSGYGQHDSQEFMNYLLDGIHEDQNLIVNKPYTELKEDYGGRPDAEVAREAWHLHQKRNKSTVVDLFQGQLKSSVTCPSCRLVSVKFDPVMYLTVPLVRSTGQRLPITFIPAGPVGNSVQPRLLEIPVSKYRDTCVKELMRGVSVKTEVPFEDLYVSVVGNHHIKQVLTSKNNVDLNPNWDIYVYQKLRANPSQGVRTLTVCHFTDDYRVFGNPMIVSVPVKTPLTNSQLYQAVFDQILRPLGWSRLLALVTLKQKELMCFCEYNCRSCTLPLDHNPLDTRLRAFAILWPGEVLRSLSNSARVALEVQVNDKAQRSVKKPLTLYDCFQLFTAVETLGADDRWFCPRCKSKKQATKKMSYWRLPQFLIIGLKRFEAGRGKINVHVDFPVRNLDIRSLLADTAPDLSSPPKYDLQAVSHHYGGTGGGHYKASVRRDEEWYLMDDSHYSHITAQDVVHPSAYILLYKRRDRPGSESVSRL